MLWGNSSFVVYQSLQPTYCRFETPEIELDSHEGQWVPYCLLANWK